MEGDGKPGGAIQITLMVHAQRTGGHERTKTRRRGKEDSAEVDAATRALQGADAKLNHWNEPKKPVNAPGRAPTKPPRRCGVSRPVVVAVAASPALVSGSGARTARSI